MDTAESTAKLSRATRLQVGALIVKDNDIISFGWNGTPAGRDNCCEYEEYIETGTHGVLDVVLKTKPEVLHAEMNALMKCAKYGKATDSATLFTTHSPCFDCAKAIYQAGIKTVWYKYPYRDTSGIDFLKDLGVIVQQLK